VRGDKMKIVISTHHEFPETNEGTEKLIKKMYGSFVEGASKMMDFTGNVEIDMKIVAESK